MIAGKKVFISGAAGFIGSFVTQRFIKAGAQVTCLVEYNSNSNIDNLEYLKEEELEKINIVYGNINDFEHLKKLMEGNEIILHLAALIPIPYSYENPRAFFRTNVLGTLNIMQAALEIGAKHVIHTSTSEVYGTPHAVPITEQFPLQAQSPYSASKIGADKVAESYYKAFSLPVTIIRPFNTFGPRQSPRAFIPSCIIQALKSDIIQHGSLTPTRDYVFVEDTAEAYLQIVEAGEKTFGKTINIATGKDLPMGEILQKIIKLQNKEIKLQQKEERIRPENSEVMRLCGDTTKLKELTGWEPKTSFDEALQKTIDWYKGNNKFSSVNRYYK